MTAVCFKKAECVRLSSEQLLASQQELKAAGRRSSATLKVVTAAQQQWMVCVHSCCLGTCRARCKLQYSSSCWGRSTVAGHVIVLCGPHCTVCLRQGYAAASQRITTKEVLEFPMRTARCSWWLLSRVASCRYRASCRCSCAVN